MPKRTDIEKILIIGSGPIIISQACEFDYSGTQAGAFVAALKAGVEKISEKGIKKRIHTESPVGVRLGLNFIFSTDIDNGRIDFSNRPNDRIFPLSRSCCRSGEKQRG